jgi:hypothetical protein
MSDAGMGRLGWRAVCAVRLMVGAWTASAAGVAGAGDTADVRAVPARVATAPSSTPLEANRPTSGARLTDPVDRESLLDDLMAWAVRLSGLPPAHDRPPVIPMSAQALSATACPDDPRPCSGLVALYDTERVRVLIRDSMDLDDPSAQSFVVHEFVHHLQHRAQGPALTSRCESVIAAEVQAYGAQNTFLARNRQLLRVGDMLRRMQCDTADGDPVVVPFGTPPRPLAGATLSPDPAR